ncbi:MAG: hypothetical protein RL885_10775 [Planctomycetota bacterium]
MPLTSTWLCSLVLALGTGAERPGMGPDAPAGPTLRQALPEGTLAYIGFPDLVTTAREYRAAAFYRLLQDENVARALAPLFAKEGFIESILDELPVPLSLEDLTALEFRRVEVAITHLSPVTREKGQFQDVDFGLVIDVQIGDSEEKWEQVVDWFGEVIDEIAGQLPDEEPSQLQIAGVEVERFGVNPSVFIASLPGNRTVMAFSRKAMDLVLPKIVSGGGSFEKSDVFQKTLSHVSRPGDDLEVWLDIGGWVQAAREIVDSELDDSTQGTFDRIVVALGLDEAGAWAWNHRIVGGEIEARTVMTGGQSRRGLFSLMPQGTVTNAMWSYVPKDALLFGHLSLGLKNILTFTKNVGKAIGSSEDLLEIKELEEKIGIDLQRDFFSKLTGEVLYYQTAPTGLIPVPGIVVMLGMTESSVLVSRAEELLAELHESAEVKKTRFRDTDIYLLKIGDEPLPIQPAWAMIDGYLVFSAHVQDLKGLLRRKGDVDQSVLASQRFQASIAKSAVPAEYATMTYYDVPAIFEILFTAGYQALSLVGSSGWIDTAQLPTASDLSQFLGASVSYSQVEPGLWTFQGRSSLGPELYVGALFGWGLFVVGMQEPAVMPTDPASMSRARIEQVLGLAEIYRREHGGYPQSLRDLGEPDPESGFLTDGWGRALVYRIEDDKVVVYSCGPNGRDDDRSEDDIRIY